MLRFPEHDLDHRQAGLSRVFVNQSCDVLGRRIDVHDEHPLTALDERRQQGIVATEQHVMIEILVDPGVDYPLDLSEIDQHAATVECLTLERDHCPAVVAVKVAALAIVVQEPMPVTELDFTCDPEHSFRYLPLLALRPWVD